MRLAIVGPRNLELPVSELERVLRESGQIDLSVVREIVTGDARGVDRAAIRFAKKAGLPWVAFGAGWGKLKKGAGPERNRRLVRYLEPGADALLALAHTLDTPGTSDVSHRASEADIFCVLHKDQRWTKYLAKEAA